MADPKHVEVLGSIQALIDKVEGRSIPDSKDFPMLVEDIRDLLVTIQQKAIILRDRLADEETSYTMGEY